MDKEGADLGGIGRGIEQRVLALAPSVTAVQGFALAPAAAPCNSRQARIRNGGFRDKVSAVGDQLAVHAEHAAQRRLALRFGVVLDLQRADGSVNKLRQHRDICRDGLSNIKVHRRGMAPTRVYHNGMPA